MRNQTRTPMHARTDTRTDTRTRKSPAFHRLLAAMQTLQVMPDLTMCLRISGRGVPHVVVETPAGRYSIAWLGRSQMYRVFFPYGWRPGRGEEGEGKQKRWDFPASAGTRGDPFTNPALNALADFFQAQVSNQEAKDSPEQATARPSA